MNNSVLKVSKYLVKFTDQKDKAWATFTAHRNLSYSGLATPQDITGSVIPKVSSMLGLEYKGTPLTDMTKGAGKTMELEGFEWTWQLRGDNYRPLVILEDYEPTVLYAGAARSIFKIKVDCNIALKGSIILFEGPQKFQARVQTDPYADGSGFILECQVMTDDDGMFIPKDMLMPGSIVQIAWAVYGEASIDAGPTTYVMDNVFKMRSWLTKLRKKYKVTGDAFRQRLNGGEFTHLLVREKKEGSPTYWGSFADMIFEKELAEDVEYAMTWSRGQNQSVMDLSSSEIVQQGPGLDELLEEAPQYTYNTFSIPLLEEALYSNYFNRVPWQKRNIVIHTGERGIKKIQDAIASIANGQWSDMAAFYIDKYGKRTEDSAVDLVFGAYYKAYRMQMGGSVTFSHLPSLDDPKINLEKDDEGYPLNSSKMYILDLGFGNAFSGDNLKYVSLKNGDVKVPICGIVNPKGVGDGNGGAYTASHSGDWYEVHALRHFGVHLHDPSYAMVLTPASRYS
ncbi:MAG TPA: hypothetical protein PKD00_06110 [Burkholderiales bacterium]|nr:hypothetical protein [Burkholderiales bacterium]